MEYAVVFKYKPIKGFFKKRVAGEYVIVALKIKMGVLLVQFMKHFKDDFYVGAIVGGIETPDEDAKEESIDQLRYDAKVEILEKKLPIKTSFKTPIKIIFIKPSKYLGKTMELHKDSRLGGGYLLIKAKVKSGFKPGETLARLTVDPEMKQMRAFTTARMKKFIK